jgi:hypothetical protein
MRLCLILARKHKHCLFGTSTEGVETICLALWEVPTPKLDSYSLLQRKFLQLYTNLSMVKLGSQLHTEQQFIYSNH